MGEKVCWHTLRPGDVFFVGNDSANRFIYMTKVVVAERFFLGKHWKGSATVFLAQRVGAEERRGATESDLCVFSDQQEATRLPAISYLT